MRSPLPMPRVASAAASAETCASISAHFHCRSPQMKPERWPKRRAFWVTIWARFITRRVTGATPPRGAAWLARASVTSDAPRFCNWACSLLRAAALGCLADEHLREQALDPLGLGRKMARQLDLARG